MYYKKISVRNLVEFIFRSGDITSGDGSFSKDAMEKGSKIHKKIQGKMGINYAAEVPLSIDINRSNFTLTVEGRADGIITTTEGITIDEIKGVYKNLEKLEEPIFVHKAQAMCYAYIYATQNHLDSITVQMTYCHLETEEIKHFSEVLTYEDLAHWFQELSNEYCKWVQFEAEEKQIRDESISTLKFPYEYRPGQKDMAGTVYLSIKRKNNLFIQAPTGIGKTMAALYPSIKSMGDGLGEKLFYLTAKTITRSVAQNGLEILRNKGLHFRSVLITAKEKICPMEETICDPEHCPYASGHYDRINHALFDCITKEIDLSREVILDYANKYTVCPFELSLDASMFVDGIICDYNYAFDPRVKLRRYFGDGGAKQDFIFLVDEAHNLVDRASSMYSTEIYKEDFLLMKRLLMPYNKKIGNLLGKCNSHLLGYKKMCAQTNQYIILPDIEDFYLCVLRLHGQLSSFMEELKEIPPLQKYKDEILDFYFQINQFINIYEILDDSYEIYAEQITKDSFMLKLYCIHPANNLTACIEKSVATIFFSATMLPINYYKELLHNNEDDYAIYIPSPFPKEHRGLFSGIDVSSRYRMRGPSLYKKIVRYLDIMVHSKQGKYMAFFPSYKMLEDVFEAASSEGLLQDIEIIKQTAHLTEEQREEFLNRFMMDETPVLGFCILGGIFSEGIDLVGDYLIGCAIIGTGLPMVCNEREIQQQFFDHRQTNGFAYAYLYPGMNKVQQAAGRVIRTMDDKGIILLLDDRFITKQVVDTFPAEWENYQVVTLNTIASKIQEFWKSL
ncbi:MAG: ATP-dependent DNA helicase [Lachnospiraceae bacterium]